MPNVLQVIQAVSGKILSFYMTCSKKDITHKEIDETYNWVDIIHWINLPTGIICSRIKKT